MKTSSSTVGISKQDQLPLLQTTEAPQYREPTGQLLYRAVSNIVETVAGLKEEIHNLKEKIKNTKKTVKENGQGKRG